MKLLKENIALLFLTTLLLSTLVFFFVKSADNLAWAQNSRIINIPENHPSGENCQSCHQGEWQVWNRSHHQKSMQIADDSSVLGDFNDVEISINDEPVKFYKNNNEFWVELDNQKYKVDYTFGFEPLQQYLIKSENGKYQILPYSWDSRPIERGGQQWFHIYGEDHIPKNDRLHWQQPLQNWNGMCADCHSTGLKRNYDAITDTFNTNWQNINVGCASCHQGDMKTIDNDDGNWTLIEGAKTMSWSNDFRNQSEIEVCAACHSRRSPLTDGFNSQDKFLDAFSPSPILMPDYYPDGQIKEEVYVWGSFLQSKMYKEGVICSDCHDPHSLSLKDEGNALCTTCHQSEFFDTPNHHNHLKTSSGAQCVNCHMSDNLYMGVDNRRDHSFRIPRPDLNHKTSSPDACSSCHTGQTPEWAADKINTWFGEKQTREIHYGEILQNVLKGVPNSETALKQLLNDENIPVIIRASAYNLLPNFPNAESAEFIENGLQSKEPLIRLGAIRGSTFIPVSDRKILLSTHLNDPFKAIRVEVVNSLSDMNINRLNEKDKDAYNMALDEFLTAQDQVMWRGEGRFNLGIFKTMQNETEAAKDLYLDAIKIDPFFPASYINLADIFKNQQDTLNDGKTLDMGLSVLPDDADLNYAKALFLIREKQSSKAMNHLKIAVQAAPENPQYSYVYAVALTDMGRGNDAYNVLRNAIKYAENDANLNMMLLNHFANMGDYQKAISYAEKLLQLFPNNPSIENTMRVLKSRLAGNT